MELWERGKEMGLGNENGVNQGVMFAP